MNRTDELANQLIEKVREYFPQPVRHFLEYKTETGSNGAAGTIVIRGRFPNQLPQFEPKLLALFDGAVTEKQKDAVLIKGKWQGIDCRLQLRCEALAAVAQ
jgi:hypothetical protein